MPLQRTAAFPALLFAGACASGGPGYPTLSDTQGPTCAEASAEHVTVGLIAEVLDLAAVIEGVRNHTAANPGLAGPTLLSVHARGGHSPQVYPLAGEPPRDFQEGMAGIVRDALLPDPGNESEAADEDDGSDGEGEPEPPRSFRIEVTPGPEPALSFHPIWTCPPYLRNEARIREIIAGSASTFPAGSWRTVLEIHVTGEGRPETIRIGTSSGNAQVDARLAQIARTARWDPARYEGLVVPVWVSQPLSVNRPARD